MFNRIKNFKRKLGRWFWVLLIFIIILAGFFIYRSRNQKEPVTVVLERGLVRQELILTGAVNAEKYSQLTFPTSGKIAWVGVKEGQTVKKGQAITSLDKTVLNTIYQQAQNNYRNYQAAAESTLDSVKGHSSDENFTQRATRTAAEVARDNAYDAMVAARYNLANATIYAPFDGIISSLPFPSAGVNVSFADVQAVVIDPSTIYFDVDADQNDVTSLSIGQKVSVVLDSYLDQELSAKVEFVSYTPKAGSAGTNYKVKVVFEGQDAVKLMPRVGMTGDAKFILGQKDSVLFVPSGFVNSDTKGKYLKVDSEKNKIYVETGLESEERTEIISSEIQEGSTIFE